MIGLYNFATKQTFRDSFNRYIKNVLSLTGEVFASAVGIGLPGFGVVNSSQKDLLEVLIRELYFSRVNENDSPDRDKTQINDLTENGAFQEIEKKFGITIDHEMRETVARNYRLSAIPLGYTKAIERIDDAIKRLQSASKTIVVRGFFNLVIGIAFATYCLFLLKESIGALNITEISKLSMPAVYYFFGIRVSTVLIISIISYFFLSLYKKSMEDAKYFQGEISVMILKSAGIFIAQNNIGGVSGDFVTTSLLRPEKSNAASEIDSSNIDFAALLKQLKDVVEKTSK